MKAKEVQAFFEKVATDWDTMRLAYYDERVIEKMAEVASVDEGSEVADVGTQGIARVMGFFPEAEFPRRPLLGSWVNKATC
jgi:hypothetical protein